MYIGIIGRKDGKTMEKPQNALGKKKQLRLMTFLIAFFVATAFFIPFLITGHGYFIFFGDFNVQQIPFYRYCHDAVRNGQFGWSYVTDLGSNFIGSYAFYLLGSPFFWLTIPFPGSVVPYLMAPLLILKFSFAALTAYLYIRRFTARAETAMIGGLLYAFSGFSVYNIFFNHFHEALVFFPLLLYSMERFMSEKKRGLLIISVFLCSVSNYYFFFGMVVFAVIYWVIRMISGSFRFRLSEFLIMLLECVLGLLLAAGLLLPAVLMVLQNGRLSSVMTGWSAILYGKEQIFLNVIQCFFFPPDLPARPVFFPGADVKWSSLGGWLPLFGMVGTITWLLSEKKGTWLRRLLIVCIFMALVPVLNSAFSMFNTAYYARWFYMPILMMALATAVSIEDTEANWNTSWRWCTFITLALTVVVGFFPKGLENGKITGFGLYTDAATNPFKYIYQLIRRSFDHTVKVDGGYYDLRFWITCLIAILSLVIVRALIPVIKSKNTSLFKPCIAMICVISAVYSVFFIACGQSHSYDIENVMIKGLIEGKVELDIDDDEYARIDVYDGVDNTGLYLGYPSINFFHSVVSSGITDFYEYIGITRSVASRPSAEYGSLRSLLSVKYLLDPTIDGAKDFTNDKGETEIPGYKEVSRDDSYVVYENGNYIPIGFTYDYYITEEQLNNFGNSHKPDVMLKALLIDDKDIALFSRYLDDIENDYYLKNYESGKRSVSLTDVSIATDCAARAATSAHSFSYDSKGFTAAISLDRPNYVFFSIPFDDGWTATVNGKNADIIKVAKGFMAVEAPAGECTIKFSYKTPGLKYGLIISAAALLAAVIYVTAVAIKRRKHPASPAEYPEGDVIERRTMLYEAARAEAENPDDDGLLDDIDRDSLDAYRGFDGGFKIDDSALGMFRDKGEDKK